MPQSPRRVRLTGKEKRRHYALGLNHFFAPIILLVSNLTQPGYNFLNLGATVFWLFWGITVLIACVGTWYQHRRLRMTPILTSLSLAELESLLETEQDLGVYTITSKTENNWVAHTTRTPTFGAMGERIELLYEPGTLHINSIPDPAKRPTITSWGRNQKHVAAWVDAVRKAEKKIRS